tara:strand:+ start:424 stop:684 length:261 start_codon:yes stop_codon:yes gene_type:complete
MMGNDSEVRLRKPELKAAYRRRIKKAVANAGAGKYRNDTWLGGERSLSWGADGSETLEGSPLDVFRKIIPHGLENSVLGWESLISI